MLLFLYFLLIIFYIFILFFVSLILALIHQTNPNWRAYFIVTDNQPFEYELMEVLRQYKEERLQYLDIPMKYRPVVSV